MKRLLRILLQLGLLIVAVTALSYARDVSPLLKDDLLRNLISYSADYGLFPMATEDTPYYYSPEEAYFSTNAQIYGIEWRGNRADWEAKAAEKASDWQRNYAPTPAPRWIVSDRGLVTFGSDTDVDVEGFAENLPIEGEYPVNGSAIRAALRQEAYIGFRQSSRYLQHHAPLGTITYLVRGFCLWTKMPLAWFFGWGGQTALLMARVVAWVLLAMVAYVMLRRLRRVQT